MGNPGNDGWMIGRAVTLLSVGLLLALISTGRAEAALPVSPAGGDSAACGTKVLPCRNVDYAVHKAANGEIVKVAGGIYRYANVVNLCAGIPIQSVVWW